MLTPLHQRLIALVTLAAVIAMIIVLCLYKVFDFDIWWHIKAGEVMLDQKRLITVDPFAFTRVGLPYLATHEWLAQVIFALFYRLGGSMGIIVLRTVLMLALALCLALIDRRRLWLYASALPVFLSMMIPGMVDRPQLFTFALHALALLLASTYLSTKSSTIRGHLLIGFVLLEILWVQLHGAAALAGIAVLGALFLQRFSDRWHDGFSPPGGKREVALLMATLVGCCIGFVLPPNGLSNIGYISSLFHDQTTQYISEWQPRPLGEYLSYTLLLWTLGIGAVILARKHLVFTLTLLFFFGILSRTAFRHEPLLVLTLIAILLHELKHAERWDQATEWLKTHAAFTLCLLVITLAWSWNRVSIGNHALALTHNAVGIGAVERTTGALAFLEREKIKGNGFNSYELGGELLFRGYPDRKVFIDGRNVDYGYPFLRQAMEASYIKQEWQALDKEWQPSHAILLFSPFLKDDTLPYVPFLEEDPAWALAYLDDTTAVYLRRTPENNPVIAREEFTVLSPELYASQQVQELTNEQLVRLEQELARIIERDSQGMRAKLLLGRLYILGGFTKEAEALLQSAADAQPSRFEPYELLAEMYRREERWSDAAAAFDTLIDRIGTTGQLDHALLAETYAKAGQHAKSLMHASRAR